MPSCWQTCVELQQRAGESLLADGISGAGPRGEFPGRPALHAGQAFQITVDFTEAELQASGVALLTDQFDNEHEQLFHLQARRRPRDPDDKGPWPRRGPGR